MFVPLVWLLMLWEPVVPLVAPVLSVEDCGEALAPVADELSVPVVDVPVVFELVVVSVFAGWAYAGVLVLEFPLIEPVLFPVWLVVAGAVPLVPMEP